MAVLQILTYLAMLLFLVMVLMRFYRIATAPVHLRWELYPVPHEKGRASYGGSRFEELNWWEKKQEKDKLGELKVMIPEILLLKGVWEHNRELWYGSFPFHFALYMFMGNIALIALAAILQLSGSTVSADSAGFNLVLFRAMEIISWIAAIIGLMGAIRLLMARITNKDLAIYSTPSHFFNIILIGAIYLTVLLAMLSSADYISELTGFYAALFTFSQPGQLSAITNWNIAITLLFMVYLPFTHMTHFFTKYFTYHKVRWEDEPNVKGGKLQASVMKWLEQPVSWSAPHIGADGRKNWIAVVSEIPSEEKKND